jgi:hypothetical protein
MAPSPGDVLCISPGVVHQQPTMERIAKYLNFAMASHGRIPGWGITPARYAYFFVWSSTEACATVRRALKLQTSPSLLLKTVLRGREAWFWDLYCCNSYTTLYMV